MDVVTLGAALNGSKKYTDQVAQSLMGGVHYRGSVSYYDDLPANPAEGDSYTVKYAGSTGSVEDGTEYTWGYDTDSQDYAWISFSKDAYSKAETDALLSGKQATLSQTQLNAVNSGIDSTKVQQIATNENNILTVADQSTQYNLAIDNSFTTTAYKIITTDTLKANTTYVICFGTLSSTDTDDTKSAVLLTYNGGTAIVQAVAERGNNIVLTITPTSDCNQMNVYAALTYANSVGDTLTVSNLQIVEKTIWDKGFTAYQPYALSNAELTTNKQDKLLTGYSATVTPTSQQTIVATDSVVEGFEKLDNNVRLNEYNISSIQQTIGDINTVLEGVL